jgi:hypothetical protein
MLITLQEDIEKPFGHICELLFLKLLNAPFFSIDVYVHVHVYKYINKYL